MRADDDGRALAAIQQLLDRGWGRPITPIVDETEGTSLTLLHLIAARRVGEVLQAAMEGQSTNDSGEAKAGTIDYTQIWPDMELSGMKHFFVEQGGNFAQDPMKSIEDCAAYVKRYLLKSS